MAKERALTLEALRVMDAIDRRGSFAAAADELGRVPSALSYTMQKLEEELDVVLFDPLGPSYQIHQCREDVVGARARFAGSRR
ncbi:LysR family transcriptional regulator [Escherichia coli]|uniref:LysR family transcriptional regulator n=1 Tax=Escherichia coli TaxID=562 RepID=A0A377DL81_ECOLX|nr:LysR family transcriptional regulator [Escherichia coli]